MLVVVLALTAAGIYLNTQSVAWSALAVGILLSGVHDYWLPTRFRLSPAGAQIRHAFLLRQKSWAQFRAYYEDNNGVLLSPFARPSRLDTFRGMYIRFAGNRESVVAYVQRHVHRENPTEGIDLGAGSIK